MKEKIGNWKKSFSNRNFKNGAYTTLISIILIAVVIVINLIASQLDLKIDLSKNEIYTLTDETKKMTDGLEDTITLYYMAGEKTKDIVVARILEKYDTLSNKIKLVEKDPVLYPKFTTQFTSEEVQENSVIVVNDKSQKSRVVPYSDMLVTQIDYNTFSQQQTGVDVEGKVSSAIQYVTAEKLPVLYQVSGHGEAEINSSLNASLEKANISIKELATLSADKVPEDCSVLLINGPLYDFNEQETKILTDYLAGGGNVIFLAAYTDETLTNLDGVLETYGIKRASGIIVEGDQNQHMSGNPLYLMPIMESSEITNSLIEERIPVIVPISVGLQETSAKKETVTTEPFLTTSDSAYSKIDVNSPTYEKEESDIDGPFHLGIMATDDNEKKSKLAVLSSSYILDETMTAGGGIGNTKLFINCINAMQEETESLSIPERSLVPEFLTLNSAQSTLWSAIVVVVLPLIILVTGIVMVVKRRRR